MNDQVVVEMIEGETKEETFKRLAAFRYTKAVKRIRMFTALANKSNYEYDMEDVERMFIMLHTELDKAHDAFIANDDTIEELF